MGDKSFLKRLVKIDIAITDKINRKGRTPKRHSSDSIKQLFKRCLKWPLSWSIPAASRLAARLFIYSSTLYILFFLSYNSFLHYTTVLPFILFPFIYSILATNIIKDPDKSGAAVDFKP